MTYSYTTQLLTFSTVPVSGTFTLVLLGNGNTGPLAFNAPSGTISNAFLQSAYGKPVAVTGNTTSGLTLGFPGSPIGSLPLLIVTANTLLDSMGNAVTVTPTMLSTVPLSPGEQTASNAQLAALQAQANQQFINMFLVAQENAIKLGQTIVYLSTFKYCDIIALTNYFQNQGYFINYPDVAPINGAQPAELFGPAWIAYWENQVPSNAQLPFTNPIRIGIAWSPPNFQFLPLFEQEV